MTTLADPISTLIGQGSPAPEADPLARITQGRALAVFLAGCVGVFALLTGLLALDRQPGEPWGGWLPPLLAGLIALGALLALAQPSRALRSRAPWLTVALLVLMMMLPVVVSGSRHLGLRGSRLALMSLVVAFTTGMLGRRTGLVFALGGTLALLALSVVERLSGLDALHRHRREPRCAPRHPPVHAGPGPHRRAGAAPHPAQGPGRWA